MIDLKKIVDDWNALIDAGDTLAVSFSKLEYEKIKRYYSVSELKNWEKGNRLLRVDSLMDFIFMSKKINNNSMSYTDAIEKLFKNNKKEDAGLVSLTNEYWGRIFSYAMSKVRNQEFLVELKNTVQNAKYMNAASAFFLRNNIEDVKDFNVVHNAFLGMIESGLENLKVTHHGALLKIKSDISKEEWLSILTDLSEHKYISMKSSEDKNNVMTWIESAFQFEKAGTVVPSAFEPWQWRKPAIALVELVSKLIAEKIIVASIEDAQEIKKVIQWMRSLFVFKTNDKSLMTYFKDARNGKLNSSCFKLLKDNVNVQFQVSY